MRAMRWLLILGFLLSVFRPAAAWAEHALARPTKPEAREHLTQGNLFYNRAKWDAAVREYKAGAQLEDLPVFDYNIAQTLRLSGEYQDSLRFYERFLDRGQPTGEVLQAVQGFIAEMRAQLANRARAASAAEPSPPPATTSPPPTARSATEVPTEPSNRAAPAADRQASRWLGWVTAGTGVAAIGVSAYLLLHASSLSDSANSEPVADKRNELRDSAKTDNVIGAITGAGGLALVVTGVFLLARHGHDQSPDTTAVNLGIAPHGVFVFGRF